MIDEACQVVAEVLEDHVCFVLLDHYFLQCNDMFVSKVLEEPYFSHSSDWEAVALAFHSNLLECDLVACVDVNGFEDFTVGSSTNNRLIAWLTVVYRFGGGEFGRKLRTRTRFRFEFLLRRRA